MNAPVTLKPQVRTAGPADQSEILRLLMLANSENAIMESNSEKVYFFVQRFLNGNLIPPEDTGPRGEFGVIGPVGKLEAVCMLGIGCFWYTTQQHIEEYLVFVDPDYRKGAWRHGLALVEWAKAKSRSLGMPLLTGILSNHRTEAKCRLYRRHLPKVGEYFMYNGDDRVPHFYSDKITGPGSMVRELTRSSSMAA